MSGQEALGRIANRGQAAWDWVSGVPTRARLAYRDVLEAKELARTKAAGPTAEERLTDLVSFYNQYERLVEAICDAAQYGPEPSLAATYTEVRAWMQANYRGIRRFATAYLRYEAEDALPSIGAGEAGGDAFEALYHAPTLEQFLKSDDGMMISRITRTREALNLYGDHLRRLIVKG